MIVSIVYTYRSVRNSVPRRSVRLFQSTVDFATFKDTLNLTKEKIDKLNELAEALTQWNLNVNLVSRKDIDLLIPNHILPCLSIYAYRPFKANERVIDVGTGGGLPGLPMAIMNLDTQFTLLDSSQKKMKVVSDIASRLGLSNVNVVCTRAEEYKAKHDFITGRAVSALPNFLKWSSHLLDYDKLLTSTAEVASSGPHSSLLTGTTDRSNIHGGLLYLKGGDCTDELLECQITPTSVAITPVSELVPGLISEKYVLYIPPIQLAAFSKRAIITAAVEAEEAERVKSSRKKAK